MDSQLPPGPRSPVWLQSIRLWGNPQGFLRSCQRRYGDLFTVRAAPLGTLVYLADPADIITVFHGDQDVFQAGKSNTILKELLGDNSVVVLDGPQHRRLRQLMAPAFRGDSVRRQTDRMAAIAAEEIATWPVGQPFRLYPRMQAIALEVILQSVIGVQDRERLTLLRRLLPALVDMNPLLMVQVLRPKLRDYWPWRAFERKKATAFRLLDEEINNCGSDAALADRTDVLATLVRARDEEGGSMGLAQLRDQLTTLLLAGHGSTATALSWVFERLVRHPAILARARRAADEDDDDYLDAIVKETLRMRPPVFDMGRYLTEPVELAGYRLPAGISVVVAIGLAQHSERNFTDPNVFDPQRFVDSPADPHAWMPFGGGNRRCLGATFASTEMRVVLREVLRRVDLETTDDPPETFRARHPRRGARVTVRTRRTTHTSGHPPD
jgi:cytochrome P450 family 135